MTTPLDALKAALEAKREAAAFFNSLSPYTTVAEDWNDAEAEMVSTDDDFNSLLTDDTIAALVAVADRWRWGNGVCVCGKVWRYSNHAHAEDCPLASLVEEADDA